MDKKHLRYVQNRPMAIEKKQTVPNLQDSQATNGPIVGHRVDPFYVQSAGAQTRPQK